VIIDDGIRTYPKIRATPTPPSGLPVQSPLKRTEQPGFSRLETALDE
jgi:hypothetical protein